jgi:hypothetical protein
MKQRLARTQKNSVLSLSDETAVSGTNLMQSQDSDWSADESFAAAAMEWVLIPPAMSCASHAMDQQRRLVAPVAALRFLAD